jgi:hypothetical protein
VAYGASIKGEASDGSEAAVVRDNKAKVCNSGFAPAVATHRNIEA